MHIPSTLQMLLIVIILVAAIIPAVKILRRMGYSGWWAVVVPISPLNIIGLWVLAFARWPADERSPFHQHRPPLSSEVKGGM